MPPFVLSPHPQAHSRGSLGVRFGSAVASFSARAAIFASASFVVIMFALLCARVGQQDRLCQPPRHPPGKKQVCGQGRHTTGCGVCARNHNPWWCALPTVRAHHTQCATPSHPPRATTTPGGRWHHALLPVVVWWTNNTRVCRSPVGVSGYPQVGGGQYPQTWVLCRGDPEPGGTGTGCDSWYINSENL